MRILLVEDDEAIAQVIKKGLEDSYDIVDVASDGESGLQLATENAYALLILDVMLPKLDGWGVCEALRARRQRVPILMLTARDGLDDRIRGLDLGADDYLSKPFNFNELQARVRALVRRDKMNKSRVLKVADLEIDTGLHTVRRAGELVHLTPREYALLEALVLREGTVVSRETIQAQAWMDDDSYSNMVDVYIRSLRRKIDVGRVTKLIQTVHRSGYMLSAPDAAVGRR